MNPIERVVSTAVPLLRDNVDTDQIIPATWMVKTEATGYEDGLFERLREDAEFVLNDPAYRGSEILISGRNFGCGSSREHAPWALRDYGFKAVIAASFADIHRGNLANVGLIPAEVGLEAAQTLAELSQRDPATSFEVDLAAAEVRVPAASLTYAFHIEGAVQRRLLAGQDLIGETMLHAAAIAQFEARRPEWMPLVEREA